MAPTKQVTKRGAKASRSALRAKPSTKPKPKPKAKKPTLRVHRTAPVRQRSAITVADDRIALGEIVVPSGELAIFDIGLVGYLPREALEPAIVKVPVPADRALRVVGAKVGKGRFKDCWDHVAILLDEGRDVLHPQKVGEAGVDFGRLVCMDLAALDHWQHEDSLDGKADFVFWGRDEAKLAHVLSAPKRPGEGYGWADLTVADAEAKADLAAKYKAENKWLLATDLRPHSHHFRVLADARKSKHGVGTLALAGTQLLLMFTSWGDGVFPIYLDLDDDDRPVQVRIQLALATAKA